MDISSILSFIVGAAAGGCLIWLLLRERLMQSEQGLESSRNQLNDMTAELMQKTAQSGIAESLLAGERKASAEKLALLQDAQSKLSDAFKALSADALKHNNESFLELAKSQLSLFQQGAQHDLEKRQTSIEELVKPLQEGLQGVSDRIKELDLSRAETYTALNEQVKNLVAVQTNLQSETQNLVRALRMPTVRGRWGEIQLKRVAEMAGMLEHCDFTQQPQVENRSESENGRLRPDMIIRLAGGKTVVVDSKVPLEAYLNSVEATDEAVRTAGLKDHARQVRDHLRKLSEKAYWDQFDQSPEFVVLFLPGEMLFSAALEQDPELIEAGVRQKIIIATPTTLIALLHAVAYGWTQERLSKSAEEISNLGRKLYARIKTFASHMSSLRNSLQKAVESHNKAVGSLESSVIPPARTLKELSVSTDSDIEDIEPIELLPRAIQSEELIPNEPLFPGAGITMDVSNSNTDRGTNGN